jgi:hypothetical protein
MCPQWGRGCLQVPEAVVVSGWDPVLRPWTIVTPQSLSVCVTLGPLQCITFRL